MEKIKSEQWIISDLDNILSWIDAFILDRKSQNMSPGTIYFYKYKLDIFQQYCLTRGVYQIKELTSKHIRDFLIWLEEQDQNDVGRFTFYRAIKTFLKWYQVENDLND